MQKTKYLLLIILAISLGMFHAWAFPQAPGASERMEMYHRYLNFVALVKGGSIEPYWMADGSSFCYSEGAPEETVIYRINPRDNTKAPLFDTARLRQALIPLLGHEPAFKGIPFEKFVFVEGEKAVRFSLEGRDFTCALDSYKMSSLPPLSETERTRLTPRLIRRGAPIGMPDEFEVLSPDRRWFLGVSDHNLYLRSTYDGRIEPLTTDGTEDYEWLTQFYFPVTEGRAGEGAKWSADSFKVVALKLDTRKVARLPIVHWLRQTEEVEFIPFTKAGMAMPQEEIFILDILSKKRVRVNTGPEPDQLLSILAWRTESREIIIGRMDRIHKKIELLAANAESGATRVVLVETQKTFVSGQASPYGQLAPVKGGQRFIWISERDGWAHLYFYDWNGNLLQRLTNGAFPVLRVVAADEKSGWVYFTAHAEKRLYDTHLYRVSLEGKGFSRLTEAPGQHEAIFSPSKEFFIDIHSSMDRPPVMELRKTDGTFLQIISKARIEALKELKWSPPEEFVVKAADGKTDLYGVLYKPYDFDPNKKYPVIDNIYGGPQSTWVSRAFMTRVYGGVLRGTLPQAMAQLGYIVFTVDGRGTPERGKEFQDVAYGNIGRNEIPDHVAALRGLAAERPFMDLTRVGIFGISWGGFMTIRALLLAPDVYHVGVSTFPVTDIYQRRPPIEPYMGLPQDNKDGYEYASNLRLADKLKGKLFLIHGTNDVNATFDATMKLAEAFIRAGKPFDLLIMPEQDHWFNGFAGQGFRYWIDALARYFLEHLSPDK